MSDNNSSNSGSERATSNSVSEKAREQGHFSAALHGSFAFLIPAFNALVQMKYPSTDPFKEHYGILLTVIVALLGYVVAGAFVIELRRKESNHYKIISKVCLLSGALATISPVLILIPILGCFLFVIWAASFAWVAYDSYPDFKELLKHAKGKVSDIWKKLMITEEGQNPLPPNQSSA